VFSFQCSVFSFQFSVFSFQFSVGWARMTEQCGGCSVAYTVWAMMKRTGVVSDEFESQQRWAGNRRNGLRQSVGLPW
jgi:hypothetical protein